MKNKPGRWVRCKASEFTRAFEHGRAVTKHTYWPRGRDNDGVTTYERFKDYAPAPLARTSRGRG